MAMQWQPKIHKRKISQSNVILEESTKKFKKSNRKKRQTSSRLNNTQAHPKANP